MPAVSRLEHFGAGAAGFGSDNLRASRDARQEGDGDAMVKPHINAEEALVPLLSVIATTALALIVLLSPA